MLGLEVSWSGQSILKKYMLEALSFNKASISMTTVSAVATKL